jgi:exosome complex component RRP42
MGDFSGEVISHIDREYVRQLLDNGERIDGRAFDEYRPIEIELNVVPAKAEGSALVNIGDTSVVAGVKVLVGDPYPDTPDQGVTVVTAELPPLASPMFELGPPRQDAIELARVVDRGVRESESVNVSKLVIEPGKKVYLVFCDVYPLEYDGNLIDASSLAVNAALGSAQYPEMKLEDGDLVETGKILKVPVENHAIECTIGKIGKHLVIDPHIKEEMVQDSRLTVAVDESQNLTAIQKGGGVGPMTLDEIDQSMGMALEASKQLREILEQALKEVE